MNAFEPVTIVEEFVYQALSGDADMATAMTAAGMATTDIYPAFSPAGSGGAHVTHDYAGPDEGIAAVPKGQAIALLTLYWDVTAWTPGPDRQPLRGVLKAAQAALTGPNIVGRRFAFVSDADGSAWAIACRYRGPILVPAEIGPGKPWQRVSGRFQIELRQKDGA